MPIQAVRNCVLDAHLEDSPISNLSLLIDRYGPRVNDPINDESKEKEKKSAFESRCGFRFHEIELYKKAHQRWKTAWESLPDVELIEVKSTTPLLLGTGNANLHEAGVQLLHPWGVPYLPGSAIKGALSSWLAKNGGEAWKADHLHKSALQTEIFGGIFNKNAYAGSVLFGDAWYDPEKSGAGNWFIRDIITVHHKNYYGQIGNHPFPHGMEDPNPVPISPLRSGLVFHIVLQGPDPVRDFLKQVLEDLLTHQGLGSKTAVGYGRFEVKKGAQDARKAVTSISSWDDLEALIHEVGPSLLEELSDTVSEKLLTFSLEELDKTMHPGSVQQLKKIHPLKHFAWLLTTKSPATLKEAKILRDQEANRKELTPSPNDPDVQKIFSIGLKLAGNEGVDIRETWLKPYEFGWEQTHYSGEQLLAIVENPDTHVWPPLNELEAYLETRTDLDADTKELIIMSLP